MITGIIGLVTLILTIAWGIVKYFHGAAYKKEQVWNEFRDLEEKYRAALAAGDPIGAANYDKRMRELRSKYIYLNRN
jgi:hypothetical protein